MNPTARLVQLGLSDAEADRVIKAVTASAVAFNMAGEDAHAHLAKAIQTSELYAKSQHDGLMQFLSLSEDERMKLIAEAVSEEL